MTLETSTLESLAEKKYDPSSASFFRKFSIDVSSGWAYYTIAFAGVIEPLVGMTGEEILGTRMKTALLQSVLLRPVGWTRNYFAKKFNLDENSLEWKRRLSDTTALLTFQIPAYAGVLLSEGVDFDFSDKKALALPLGVAFVAGTAGIYGKWMDKWRDWHGVKPAIYKAPEKLELEKTGWDRARETYTEIMSVDVNPFRKKVAAYSISARKF